MSEKATGKRQTGRHRGIPEVKRAENGYYYVHWSDGRRSKRQSLGTQDEAQARKTFAHWLLIDGAHRGQAEAAYTLDQVWSTYLDKHVKRNNVSTTLADYSWQNLKQHFAGLTVAQFTQEQVDRYAERRRTGQIGRKSVSSTVRRELAYLIAAINYCAGPKQKMVAKGDIQPVDLPSASPPRERWLRVEEIKALLDAAARGRLNDGRLTKIERFLWIAVQTGARKSAILNLEWSRVDFETGTIDFNEPGRRQTNKRRAVVPISASLRPVLERAYRERTSVFVLDNNNDSIWAAMQIVVYNAGLGGKPTGKGKAPSGTGISPHTLRHSVATLMARNGVPLWDVANTLGNTLQVTEKVYSKWTPDNPAGTLDRIGKLELPDDRDV